MEAGIVNYSFYINAAYGLVTVTLIALFVFYSRYRGDLGNDEA